MANPFSHGGGSNSMMLPLMMMSMMQQPQAPAQAPMAPQGSPDLFKKPGGQGSFAGGAVAAAPTSNQLGGKSLLGG